MRDELPEECMRELDYRALVETLALLEDENVCLSMSGLESHSGEKGPLVTVSGVLHKAGHSGNSFAIGASGRLVLYEQDFVSASLRTYDGNDYFTLTIHFSKVSIVLSDEIYGLEAPTTSA